MPRQARLDAPGVLHHVMVRGIEQGKIVDGRKDREDFIRRMGRIAVDSGTSIYAWAIMNNHTHILLRSGNTGLAAYMKGLLTVAYNLRYKRHGHLFQNRYKSIVCEEETYFQEVIRYIHLNPLRAGEVKSIPELDRYPWSGHAAIMGQIDNDWQDKAYVLSVFGSTPVRAVEIYRRYLQEGISEVSRTKSYTGFDKERSPSQGIKGDERIIGSSEFIERIIGKEEELSNLNTYPEERRQEFEMEIENTCEQAGITIFELRAGSRRRAVSRVRRELVCRLAGGYGMSLSEVGRELGVSVSAVSRILAQKDSYSN